MPILANARKAQRVSKKKTEVNSRVKSIVKTMVDKVKKTPSAANLATAYSALDTAVRKHLLHKNKAARVKSQLSKLAKPEKIEKTAPAKKATATKKAATKSTASKTVKKAAPKRSAAKKTAKK
ncbi:MAG: hypothetical protein BroJett025_09980 [Patescibacteria group bacterium]|nr:MAG: hypothetical protein BroJett025_09980 [Patescibacteria group bacterium]